MLLGGFSLRPLRSCSLFLARSLSLSLLLLHSRVFPHLRAGLCAAVRAKGPGAQYGGLAAVVVPFFGLFFSHRKPAYHNRTGFPLSIPTSQSSVLWPLVPCWVWFCCVGGLRRRSSYGVVFSFFFFLPLLPFIRTHLSGRGFWSRLDFALLLLFFFVLPFWGIFIEEFQSFEDTAQAKEMHSVFRVCVCVWVGF